MENEEKWYEVVSYTGDIFVESADMEECFGPFETEEEAQIECDKLNAEKEG